jgi:hypothetical protein
MAAERIALVIGNSDYAHFTALDHVKSDVAVMADTLRGLDFDVEAVMDLDRSDMEDRIARFGERIDQAGAETIGLLFYAGHGFALAGSNYLLPVDAAIEAVEDVERAAIDLDLTLAEIAFAANDHKLVILDVSTRSGIKDEIGVSPGLTAIDAPVGTLVAFGARPRTSDREPRYQGLYPLALASAMTKPGLKVEQVFQEVRLNVAEATDGVQIPWEASSLISPVYLAGAPAGGGDSTASQRDRRSALSIGSLDPRTADLVFWSGIEVSLDPSDFADYLKNFPTGVFRHLAERRLATLSEIDATKATNPPDSAPAASSLAAASPAVSNGETTFRVDNLRQTMITQKRANVRATPGSSGVIVATIEANQTLEVTGDVVDRDWFRIKLDSAIDAYMWAPLLDASPPDRREVDLASTLPPSRSALLGRWQGEYQCQWDTIGFTLDIHDQDGAEHQEIDAVFSFYALPGAPPMPSGSFAMTGDYDANDGTIVLKSSSWIERPLGLQRHDLAGRAKIGGSEIKGRIETAGCSDFYLTRGNATHQSAVQSMSTQ